MITIDDLRPFKTTAVRHRRHLHENPEIGFDLPETFAYVSAQLNKLKIPFIAPIGHYSLIGMIENGTGPIIGLRADMDALPIQEQNTSVSYVSRINNRMHACGHDAHTAILLTVADYLQTHKDQWNGTVKFIFQEAEEGPDPGGALAIVKSSYVDDVNVFFALHCSPDLSVGTFGIKEGAMMAAADTLTLQIFGKGAHAAYPHLGINPVSIQAEIIIQINQIIPKRINPNELCVITISQVHSGSTHNVIPEKAYLQGTIRTFNPLIRRQISDEIKQIVQKVTKKYKATYHLDYQWGYDAVINQKEPTESLIAIIDQLVGIDHRIVLEKPHMVAEDFSKYIQHKTGALVWLGTSSSPETSFGLHHPQFNIDEEALLYGMGLFVNLICNEKQKEIKS